MGNRPILGLKTIQHPSWINSVHFHPSLPYLACGGKDSSVYIYSTTSFSLLKQIKLDSKPINTVHFHPIDPKIIYGGDDNILF